MKKNIYRMNKIFLVLTLFVSMVSAAAGAQTFNIAFNDSSAQLGYGFLVGGSSYGRNEFKVDFLFNDEDVYMVDVGLQVFDEVGSKAQGLTAGLGGKLYGATLGDADRDMIVLGVGGMVRYALPQIRRLIIGGDLYYAPPIISFIDAEGFYEAAARLEFELLPTASIYLEYHKITMQDNDRDRDLNKGGRLGVEISF